MLVANPYISTARPIFIVQCLMRSPHVDQMICHVYERSCGIFINSRVNYVCLSVRLAPSQSDSHHIIPSVTEGELWAGFLCGLSLVFDAASDHCVVISADHGVVALRICLSVAQI